MAPRRFSPLNAVVLAGAAVLIARLFQVQIIEAEIWTEQAAGLVRSGSVRPYRRGSILDAQGRELCRDERVYRLLFNYRDFRRGHPLGLVAHARTALLGEPVPLADALANLRDWTLELSALSAEQLDAFGRGEALRLGTRDIAATATAERDARRMRRSDVRFYLVQLFELEPRHAREFAKLLKQRPSEPVLRLAAEARILGDARSERERQAAQARGPAEADALSERLSERLAACAADLDCLARQLDDDARARGEALDGAPPIERLLARLELWRAEVEDDTANELFDEVFGFHPGCIEPALAHQSLDLGWIEALLGWDAPRSLRWLERARARWRDALLIGSVDRLIAELQVAALERDGAELVLDRWALALAQAPERALLEGWRACDQLVVLGALDELFEVSAERVTDVAGLLPWQDPEALEASAPLSASWATLARVELGPEAEVGELAALSAAWSEALGGRVDTAFVREHSRALLARWEHELQLALEQEFAALLAAASGAGQARLAPAKVRLERAAERARYVLKDRGSRALVVARDPSYATVHVLTRHRDRFAGLHVEESTERVRLLDARGLPVAAGLIGSVGELDLRESLIEGELRRHFMELRARSERSAEEEGELRFLARRIVRGDELRGRSGLEGYYDRQLSGRNGYREARGLQNKVDGVYQVDVPPEDGLDLELTLDAGLQMAALECLAAPAGPPDPSARDQAWLERPTGAIVLLENGGDVLAAASFPDFVRDAGESPSPRDLPLERTLRKAPFQPPGSSFKPFVASWALAHLDLNPMTPQLCAPMANGRGAGYVDVRCGSTHGHGSVALRSAIQQSCNSYFARLGEGFAPADWRGLAAEFGFGEPTGVRALGPRSGWIENSVPGLFREDLTEKQSRLAGNGLALVEATPMQIARATAGLATGVLPEVRLVRRIGELEQPARSRPLNLPGAALAFVRDAMFAVANEPHGSAQPALGKGELGFRVGAKTGSGDIDSAVEIAADGRPRVRKHTWLIAFFPYEAPRWTLVVYCDDTLQTASNSAIWLARQFLLRPELQALVRAEAAR